MGKNITINGDKWFFELMLDRPDRNGETGTEYLKKNGMNTSVC